MSWNYRYPPSADVQGPNLASATPAISHPIHHFVTTAEITTLTPPITLGNDFIGPVYLVADSVFKWTTSGNIGAPNATTIIANNAYCFIYNRTAGKWYPVAMSY